MTTWPWVPQRTSGVHPAVHCEPPGLASPMCRWLRDPVTAVGTPNYAGGAMARALSCALAAAAAIAGCGLAAAEGEVWDGNKFVPKSEAGSIPPPNLNVGGQQITDDSLAHLDVRRPRRAAPCSICKLHRCLGIILLLVPNLSPLPPLLPMLCLEDSSGGAPAFAPAPPVLPLWCMLPPRLPLTIVPRWSLVSVSLRSPS